MDGKWHADIDALAKQIAHDVIIEGHQELLAAMTQSIVAYAHHLLAILHHAVEEDAIPESAPVVPIQSLPGPRPLPPLRGLDSHRRQAAIGALLKARGNKMLATRLLGISQKTIYNWMKEFGLAWDDVRGQQAPESVRPWPEIEKEVIDTALSQTNGNKMQAARLLGINVKTLYLHLAKVTPLASMEARLDAINAGSIKPAPEERNLIRAMELAEGHIGRAARYLSMGEGKLVCLLRKYGYSALGHGQIVDWKKRAEKRPPLKNWRPE